MKKFIADNNFSKFHFTTVKSAGDMKNIFSRETFLKTLNLNPKNLVFANQIHGSDVKIVGDGDKNSIVDGCDGLISESEDIILGVFTADCMPVLISAKKGKVKAAIHSGWRGLALGIVEKTIEILKSNFCVKSEEIKAYIGPHIRSCCYEVSADMETKFNVKLKNNKLDLSEIAVGKLKKCGLKDSDIYVSGKCTFHDKDLFFSYRRDKCAQRMLTAIV
jgi:YfiH family protein